MSEVRKVRGALIGLVCLLTCTLPVQADEVTGAVKSGLSSAAVFAGESKNEFQTFEYARDYLKKQLILRQENISFTVISKEADKDLGNKLLEAAEAVDSSTKGREGDYLKLSIERIAAPSKKNTIVPVYQSGSSTKVAYYEHHIQLLVNYYTTWNQEQAMTQRIAQVLADLDLGGMSDYEKIETIYSYVCRTVAYDNSDDDLKFSAYGALVNRRAVCQGYASLLYRMLREAGIENRIITGTASKVAHSWNIVKIGSKFYNLDATWDAGSDPEDFKWFLKTNEEFTNHVRELDYTTAAFNGAYPMAVESYCFGNHTWAKTYTVDVEATCSSYGMKSIHCVKCGEIKEGSIKEIPKKPHTYGKWQTVEKPTVFETGSKVRTCTVCGEEQTRSLKKLTSKAVLNASSIQLKVGQRSGALSLQEISNGDSVKKWTSSKPSVVSINSRSGKMTAKRKGSAVITVTLKSGVTASCKVKVGTGTVRAKTIAFEKKNRTMSVGDTLELSVKKNPITAADKIVYVVSKNGVLSLENGVITAEKPGTAYVKATTKSGLTAKCKIVVK